MSNMYDQELMMALPWYKEGLRFKCTGCGKCCTGKSGFVFISQEEVSEAAKLLNLDEKTFKMRYIRTRDNRLALVEKRNERGEYDCIFLKDKICQIYQARPIQCRTYPWWPENLNTPDSWELTSKECEGINDEAPLISCKEIEGAIENRLLSKEV